MKYPSVIRQRLPKDYFVGHISDQHAQRSFDMEFDQRKSDHTNHRTPALFPEKQPKDEEHRAKQYLHVDCHHSSITVSSLLGRRQLMEQVEQMCT